MEKAMETELRITVDEFKNTKLLIYTVSVCGCKKPTLWIERSGKMIKLASFVDIERAELFVDFFFERGLPVELIDRDECEKYTEE